MTAALDCSNLWVLKAREPDLGLHMSMHDNKTWMTGTHAVHFLRVPDISGDYRVVTRFLRQEGRKGFTIAALLDREGTAYAVAEAISILTRARLKFSPDKKILELARLRHVGLWPIMSA